MAGAGTPGGPAPPAAPRPSRRRAVVAAALVAGAIALVVVTRVVLSPRGPGGPSRRVEASHVGRQVCAECHPEQARRWAGSHHDLAMQVADERTVLGDFGDATFTYAGVASRF